MPTLWQQVPDRFEDGRHRALEAGAIAAGYSIRDATRELPQGRKGDVLLTWNMHGARQAVAERFVALGGRHVVVEEGYTRYLHPVAHFAMALGGHNGAGEWHPGGAERWQALGLELAPWREAGRHILVCGQRGIGSRTMASPQGWHEDVARRLRTMTDREVVVRPHPGKNKASAPPLDEQLAGAWAMVVWSSGAAVRALLRGIPVFFEAPHHVLAPAMERGINGIEAPRYPGRAYAFACMAWAQWSLAEIRTGAPFRHLLR